MISLIFNFFVTNLPLILIALLLISGLIVLFDVLFWKKQRQMMPKASQSPPMLIDYARSFLPVFIFVIVLRSFMFQPFKVPTGSLEPTVLPGDYLYVSQYSYGLRLPIWRTLLVPVSKPQRGQIIVFHWPVDERVLFVKRLIGMPGDHISYVNRVLTINGQVMKQKFIKDTQDIESDGNLKAKEMQEDLFGFKHNLLIIPSRPSTDFKDLVVPKGKYFMMGDNRDNSDDSRGWGFVTARQMEGRARFIFFSWDSVKHSARWHHMFHRV